MSSPNVYNVNVDAAEEHVTVNRMKSPQPQQQPWVRFSSDYVRCFCNLPQCVSTGYMCKSSEGGCFSNFLDHFGHHSRDYRGRHGCLELLSDKEHRSLCENSPQTDNKDPKSLIFCCYHDMCNHVDSPQTKHLFNNSLLTNNIANKDRLQEIIGERPVNYTDSQVWFRAATIAVPVCGAVILFVLIALAIKILRSENEHSSNRKLGTHPNKHTCEKLDCSYDNILRKQRYVPQEGEDLHRIQMPLLIQNQINPQGSGLKNDTNAKLNFITDYKEAKTSVILDIEKTQPKCSEINLAKSAISDEKICNKNKHTV